MLCWVVSALCAVAYGLSMGDPSQQPLTPPGPMFDNLPPGYTIVRLCPESRDTDILTIENMVNWPLYPVLNEGADLFIWGNLSQNISAEAPLNLQFNATANNGEFGSFTGDYHICDWLEAMHQPPDSKVPDKACPPHEGPIFINYAFWFADFLVAPGLWSVKLDVKTEEGDRIYCLETEFDLQCPPERDDPICMRNLTGTAHSEPPFPLH